MRSASRRAARPPDPTAKAIPAALNCTALKPTESSGDHVWPPSVEVDRFDCGRGLFAELHVDGLRAFATAIWLGLE